jgi:hypothetical protein
MTVGGVPLSAHEPTSPQPSPDANSAALTHAALDRLRDLLYAEQEKSSTNDFAVVEQYIIRKQRAAGVFPPTLTRCLPAEDVADAALAVHQLAHRFNGVPFAVRTDSRLGRGLAVLYKANVVTLCASSARLLSLAGAHLVALEIRFRKQKASV